MALPVSDAQVLALRAFLSHAKEEMASLVYQRGAARRGRSAGRLVRHPGDVGGPFLPGELLAGIGADGGHGYCRAGLASRTR
jgi:hypothetical protein